VSRPLLVIVGAFAVLIVVGLIAGSVLDSKGAHDSNPFNAEMTLSQYDALKLGAAEQDVVDRLQQTGLPENQVQEKYTRLFPPHSTSVGCSYWYVSGQGGELARLCFTSPDGLLKQKLRREAKAAGAP
jgi:hypothetical protein